MHEALDSLGVDDLAVVAMSKGPDRHAGREQFHVRNKQSFTLLPDSAAMHFLQRLRDGLTATPLERTARNVRRPNLQVHLMRFPALGQSAKKPCWRISARRGRFQPPASAIWKPLMGFLKNLLNKFTIGSIVSDSWLEVFNIITSEECTTARHLSNSRRLIPCSH